MELVILESTQEHVRAGYTCPCGCTPSVDYRRGVDLVTEGCCCGNHFAVGPAAAATLRPREGFHPELQPFESPWGQRLEAAWLIGPSTHEPEGNEHAGEEHEDRAEATDEALDPVCGMSVVPQLARDKGLHSSHGGQDYFFCGRGCKLDFDEDPGRYLDPGYVPSM